MFTEIENEEIVHNQNQQMKFQARIIRKIVGSQNHYVVREIYFINFRVIDYFLVKGPFIYYLSTCRGEGGQKMSIFAYS